MFPCVKGLLTGERKDSCPKREKQAILIPWIGISVTTPGRFPSLISDFRICFWIV